MTPSFAGAEAKAARAFEHIKTLNEDMLGFFHSHRYAVGGHYKADTGEIDLYATSVAGKFPIVEWGVRIGDCVHNLRSALDHAVWQLALVHLQRNPTDDEARSIQFPIADTRRRFQDAGVRPFLSDTHFQWLDQYQPYKAGNQASHHKLAILRELSNTDKHRVVHAAAVVPEGFDLEFTDTSGVVSYESIELYVGEPLKDDTPIGRLHGVVVDGPDPRMDAQGPFTVGVVFDDPTNPVLHKTSVIHVLGLVGEMADGIVGWIAHQFAPSMGGSK